MCNDSNKFTHLHVHTDASPDGLGTIQKLVGRAVEIGFDSLAITDHGTLANSVAFWHECNQQGIKPILGLEGYMAWNGQRCHVTLNAQNQTGFNNLVRLSNEAHKNYTSGFSLMTIDMMDKYNEGIVAFTGCPASPIHLGNYNDGLDWASQMATIYKDRFYAEMMFVMDEDFVTRPLTIAKEIGLPIIVTNDVHFPLNGQQKIHKIMTECRKGYNYESDRLWLKNYDQMLQAGKYQFTEEEIEKMLITTWELGQSVEQWDFKAKPNLPEAKELVEHLYEKLFSGLQKDINSKPSEETTRLQRYAYELKILESKDFIDYFAILLNLVEFCWANNILIGHGRGSAASSYLLYILGITSLDPIEYNLPFERFMNPDRKEYPDVDLDIESERRQEVIDYAMNKWGAVPIATYSHYSHKVLTKDLGRILGVDFKTTELAAEKGFDSEAFEIFAEKDPIIVDAYQAIEGQIRHTGKHAGGIIITDQIVPIENVGGTLVAAWTEGEARYLTEVGVVKFDVLGVMAISQVNRMRKIAKKVGWYPNPKDFPEVFDIFKSGNVLGIFQWTGSEGIRQLTMNIQPENFYDLIVINALYRPGALDAGTAEHYPEFKLNPRKFHPLVDPILESTNGVIVFQEQVMSLIQTVLGGTLAQADLARRLIFKSHPEDPSWIAQVDELKNNFIASGIDKGIKPKTIQQLWAEIITHARYSFNLSHAASYSLMAFEMAYYKLHYPLIFYSVMMTTDIANQQSYLIEATAKGIEFLLPNINKPEKEFTIVGDKIQMPLSIVGFLSADSAGYIQEEFLENGPFTSYKNFDERIPSKKCTSRPITYLWYLGAFDGLKGSITDIGRFKEEPEVVSAEQSQMEALGFVLPTKKVAEVLLSNYDENLALGYVQSWKDKKNKKGNMYRVYSLAPYGSFWTSDDEKMAKIEKGMLIKAIKNSYGMAQKIFKINS